MKWPASSAEHNASAFPPSVASSLEGRLRDQGNKTAAAGSGSWSCPCAWARSSVFSGMVEGWESTLSLPWYMFPDAVRRLASVATDLLAWHLQVGRSPALWPWHQRKLAAGTLAPLILTTMLWLQQCQSTDTCRIKWLLLARLQQLTQRDGFTIILWPTANLREALTLLQIFFSLL